VVASAGYRCMTGAPSFEDIFAVMSAASVGDTAARVAVPDGAQLDDTATKFAMALNVLLDDLQLSAADAQRELAERGRLAKRLRILAEAAQEFSATTYDLDRLLDAVAHRLGELVGDMCAIRAASDDGEWLESEGAVYHRDPELLPATREVMGLGRQRIGEGISGRVAAAGKPLLIPKIDPAEFAASSEPRYRPYLERLGITSAIILPLMCRGKVVGVASLMRSRPDAPYDVDDLHLVQSVGDHAALAIGNARSLSAERAARDAAEKATKALRLAEARFAHLSEAGILGIVILRLDSLAVVDINGTLLDLLGVSRDEILSGRVAWTSLTPPGWSDLDTAAIAQLRSSGVAGLREKEFLRKDGKRVPVLVGSAMLDDGTTECISFVLDLTERKAAEAAVEHLREQAAADASVRQTEERLRASEERFRSLVGSVKDYAISMLDPAGLVTSWNAGAERIKGYTSEDILGQHFSRFYPPEDVRDGKPARALRVAVAGGSWEDEGWRVRKDGSRFMANVVITAVSDASGKLVGFAKVTRDVTERYLAEAALKLSNRELEAFSYSVAHDLRAPLRGMNGFAQVLLDTYKDKLDAEGRDWLQEILSNARKMGELIDALLSLARVTRSDLKPERVDLSAVAHAAATAIASADPARSVELVIEPGLVAEIDPRLARAIFDNLLGNAWKFTRGTLGARVAVGLSKDGAPTFFVRDNGAGFDMAFTSKLFGPFQRLHTVGEFPGTGIGLATVQRIVHRHGGRIWAEGAVNQGATFYFTLPGARSEDREARAGR